MIIRSNRSENARRFADALSKLETVKEFRVVPTGA
jgi:hypothetical protein